MAAALKTSDNFAQIFNGQSHNVFFEDERCIVYDEIRRPAAPTHFVVAPKAVMPRVADARAEDEKLLGHMLLVVQRIAGERALGGYHVVVEEEPRDSTLRALHVFGRTLLHMAWPVSGPGCRL